MSSNSLENSVFCQQLNLKLLLPGFVTVYSDSTNSASGSRVRINGLSLIGRCEGSDEIITFRIIDHLVPYFRISSFLFSSKKSQENQCLLFSESFYKNS